MLREAISSVLSRPFRLLFALVALGSLFGSTLWVEAMSFAVAEDNYKSAVKNGANILVVTSEGEGISSFSCLAASSQPLVVSSGSINHAEAQRPLLLEDSPIQVGSVSPGFIDIISEGRIGTLNTVVSGSSLAKELGLSPGSSIDLVDESSVVITDVLEPTNRNIEQSRWVMILEHPTEPLVDSCWIETTSESNATVKAAIGSFFPTDRDLNVATISGAKDGIEALDDWENRPTASAWIVSGVSCSMILFFYYLIKRPEYSLYSFLGWSRARLMLLISLELFILTIIANFASSMTVISFIISKYSLSQSILHVILYSNLLALSLLYVGIFIISSISLFTDHSSVVRRRS